MRLTLTAPYSKVIHRITSFSSSSASPNWPAHKEHQCSFQPLQNHTCTHTDTVLNSQTEIQASKLVCLGHKEVHRNNEYF